MSELFLTKWPGSCLESFEDPWLDAGGMPEHESSTSQKRALFPPSSTGFQYPLLVTQGVFWEFFLSNFHQFSKHRFTEKWNKSVVPYGVAIDFVTQFKEMAGVQFDFVHLPNFLKTFYCQKVDVSCAKLGSAFNFFSKHQAMEIDAKNRLHAVCYDSQC